ncbi:MAG: hypothetical protein NDJ89_00075 [Oligoflexia bacterium]|nr:hypothetical protein [Oligoflexia bacterium]
MVGIRIIHHLCVALLLILAAEARAESYALPEACLSRAIAVEGSGYAPCASSSSDGFTEVRRLADGLSDIAWIRQKIEQLQEIRKLELEALQPVLRTLQAGSGTAARESRQLQADLALLFEVSREISVLRRKIRILRREGTGNLLADREDELARLEGIRSAVLEKAPLLNGEAVTQLIEERFRADAPPDEAMMRQALAAVMSDGLRELEKRLEGYARALSAPRPRLEGRLLGEVFRSGVAERDFESERFSGSACRQLRNFQEELRLGRIRSGIADATLIALPLFAGELGLAGRALMLGRGGSQAAATASAARLPEFGMVAASLGLQSKKLSDLNGRCQERLSDFNAHPTREGYRLVQECREERGTQVVLLAAGAGMAGGALAFKTLSSALRARIDASVAAAAGEASEVKPSLVKLLAKDFGVGQYGTITGELRGIRELTRQSKRELAALWPGLVTKERDVRDFIARNALRKEIQGHRIVPLGKLEDYERTIAKDTVELLYVPGANVPHLHKSVNHVGHLAMRIGDRVYHQTGGSGFRIESLREFLTETKKDFKVFGTVLQVSPREREIMRRYFEGLHEKQVPYSFLLNNCAQAVCRALDLAEVRRPRGLAAFDPVLTTAALKRSERRVLKTAYNIDRDLPPAALKAATLSNRAVFYGLPAGAAGAGAYGIIEAVDLLVDYIDSAQEEP